MKKFSLLFAMLLLIVGGAWATDITEPTTKVTDLGGKYYKMYYVFTDAELPVYVSGTTVKCASSATTTPSVFYFSEADADGYYNISYTDGTTTYYWQFNLTSGMVTAQTSACPVKIYASTYTEGNYWLVGYNSSESKPNRAFIGNGSDASLNYNSRAANTISVGQTAKGTWNSEIKLVEVEAPKYVENTYVIKMNGTQIASYTHEDEIGAAPAGLSAPSYVQVDKTDAPATCTSTESTFTYEVSYTTAMPFKTDGTKYSMTIRDDATPQWSIYVDPAATTTVKSIQSTATNYTTPTTENYDYFNWTFEGDWYNGFNIKNAKTNAYLTYGTSASPADNTAATTTEALNEGAYFLMTYTNSRFCFKIKGTTNNTFINKRGDNLGTWASSGADGETGSAIKICDAVYVADNQVLVDAIATAQKYTVGTNYGQYTGLTAAELSTAISTAQGYLTSTDKTEIENAAAALNTEVAKLTINLPKAGDCLRIKGTTNATYVGSGLASNSKYSRTEDATESVFFFDGTTLKNISTGNYVAVTSSSWAWATTAEDAKTVVFGSSQIGKYTVKSDDIYLYDADGYVDRGQSPDLTVENQYDTWNLEKAENFVSANMNIRAALGCATFCAPFEVAIPNGVKAYKTYDAHTWVGLTEITDGVIPAEIPVVLYCENDFEDTFTGAPSANTECTDGVLTGNIGTEKAPVATGKYLLQNNAQGTGWYEVTNDPDQLYIGVNRCVMNCLTPVNGGNARAYVPMAIGDATGINDIATEAATKADGKYLVNGKIVVVKAGKAYNMGGQEVK